MSSRLRMIPPSHAATRYPPKRGAARTTRPATISTMPTMCIASAALPGMMLLKSLDRYFVQSSVRTFANLSRPNRIGATVNAIRISRNACAAGSLRSARASGIGTGRRVAATVLMTRLSSVRGRGTTVAPLLARASCPNLPRDMCGTGENGRMGTRRVLPAVLAAAAAIAIAACGGGHSTTTNAERTKQTISVWILENEPNRVQAATADFATFTRRTGIRVRLRALGDDDLAAAVTSARADRTLPDVMQLPLASVHAYAAQGLLDSAAAGDVLGRLGDETFSQTALSLISRDGRPAAVPSDGWGELLIYRKDLFRRAGLPRPRTLDDVERAARVLDRPGTRRGITLATAPGDTFTAQTFEHVALAAGCQVVDDQGRIRLTSARCQRAFRLYVDLARNHSPREIQDVDSTRRTYFAGRAAMIFWSPFLLDAMAGLRNDAIPTCPECRADPAFLARNSGLVGPLQSGDGVTPAAQFGELSSWGITRGAHTEAASRFVEYMLSDGYLRWLAISPQGKYPVRTGDQQDSERFATAWMELPSGVDRKAPLSRFYGQVLNDSLGDGVRGFQRWGFPQGEAPLMGALRNQEPITRPLALAIVGTIDPPTAARQAQLEVQAVKDGLR